MLRKGEAVKILAPAKVNLFLEIRAKRKDGFHEIRSLIQPVSLFDTLRIQVEENGPTLQCPGHPELENESNLVIQAVRLLERELGRPLPLSILLEKKIPQGAGLGGGSSDAAAALEGIHCLLGCPLPSDRIRRLAERLGSDVPFFLARSTALVTGRGEKISPWPHFPKYWYVLIFPGFSVSTAWAYSQIKLPLTGGKKSIILKRLKEKGLGPEKDRLRNDLERAVIPVYPEIEDIKAALHAQGCLAALMSGSGSAVFGVWEEERPARKAWKRLKQEPGWKIFLARGL
jgi:4-diphosphocytidyl-2-C-methyl-D-erythritol kinase